MKNQKTLEERLLTTKEIDEKISELQKMKLFAKQGKNYVPQIKRITDIALVSEENMYDYSTYYEVSDVKNATFYYLNGVQVASLFGMNDELKKQFAQKYTNGQTQIDDKLISFYYREEK